MAKKSMKKNNMKGAGFFSDLIDKAKALHNKVKEEKYISKGLTAIAPVLGVYGEPINKAAQVASLLGYKGKRKNKRKMK